jgi:gliding motility-associated-like protein
MAVALVIASISLTAQITSTFNSNAEGWTAPNANGGATYLATGGNPAGRIAGSPFVFVLGATTIYVPFYFVAPGTYRGNRSAYYNGTLQYDIQLSSTAGTANQYAEVSIGNSSLDTLYYFPTVSNTPSTAWTTYSVTFNNALGFWKTSNSPTGATASEALMLGVLTNLTGLEIRGLYRDANINTRLDNVSLSQPILITTQPNSPTTCAGPTVSLTTAATNNPAITYQWQRETSPTVWGNVTNGGGYGGATTVTLSINTTGNFGAGNYRCKISGTAVADVFTNTAVVTINSLPIAPTATGAAICGSGTLILNAAGGTAGQYRWYTLPTGGTAIAGQTNSAYTTPVITGTTTYYVSINNGTCESTRTSVIATINTPPAAPTATGNSACGPISISLNAAGGAAGQYRWYTLPTGGTAIAGETNSIYQTPVISATTIYYVSINNGTCESTRTAATATILTTGCNTIPPTINPVPLTTIVAGKITLDLVPLIVAPGVLDVNSITIVTPPSSGASASVGNGILTIDYAGKVFTGIESITIRACDVGGLCSAQTFTIEVAGDIIVYNAISPNNDKKNEILFIQYIDVIPGKEKNTVSIYNRWGSKVFEKKNYNNTTAVFKGLSDSGDELPSGTYFYKIAFDNGSKPKMGYLVLKH